MKQEHPKKLMLELLPYLTEQERAELATLATPPSNACYCLTVHSAGGNYEAETQEALATYVHLNGYTPPVVLHVVPISPNVMGG